MARPASLVCIMVAACFWPTPGTLGFDRSYWAWQRSDPLSEAEMSELAHQEVHTIYWHVGELENQSDQWNWKVRYRFPAPDTPTLRFVPVVRLVTREAEPLSTASTDALVAALAPTAKIAGDLQLDFDCPDRLLDHYCAALKKIHRVTSGRLSITALPHWSRPNSLRQIAGSADELFPMLYDYEAEPVLRSDAQPQALIDPARMAKMLREWSACPKPWHAGLPCFARLTVYDSNGKSRGQIRNWSWDEIVLNRALLLAGPVQLGTGLVRARSGIRIANTQLQAADQLAVRITDRSTLAQTIAALKETSAQGVVLFRLPDSSASSGWSLRQLGHLDASPRLSIAPSTTNKSLILRNEGDGDLPPIFSDSPDGQRGYALEVAFDAPVLREVEPGDFVHVVTSAESAGRPHEVAVPFATAVSFPFPNLRAGQAMETGLIQLAPGASLRHARWRIRNADEIWKPVE